MGVNTTSRDPVFRFDGFGLDRRGSLARQHESGRWEPVTIGSCALDVLTALVEISALRRILDQGSAGGSCIQTVIGRGYRFLPAMLSLWRLNAMKYPDRPFLKGSNWRVSSPVIGRSMLITRAPRSARTIVQ
jgi:hypothetical protein